MRKGAGPGPHSSTVKCPHPPCALPHLRHPLLASSYCRDRHTAVPLHNLRSISRYLKSHCPSQSMYWGFKDSELSQRTKQHHRGAEDNRDGHLAVKDRARTRPSHQPGQHGKSLPRGHSSHAPREPASSRSQGGCVCCLGWEGGSHILKKEQQLPRGRAVGFQAGCRPAHGPMLVLVLTSPLPASRWFSSTKSGPG